MCLFSGDAKIIEASDGDSMGVIAMEYISLGSLLTWMEEFLGSSVLLGEKDTQRLLRSIYSLIECTVHLHDLDIVHRDLKPANILRANASRVKIADFGESKPIATNALFGTATRDQMSYKVSRGDSDKSFTLAHVNSCAWNI